MPIGPLTGPLQLALQKKHLVRLSGKTEEGGKAKSKVERPQDGRQKSGQSIGNPYQMENNKTPKGAARSGAPLGRCRRRCIVVVHLVRISCVFVSFRSPF